jgi:hypothetical protein
MAEITDSKDIVRKEERKEERKSTRKARKRVCFQLVIIEDSIDDLSERRLQFFSRAEAYRTVQETIRNWKSYQWSLPLPPIPSCDKFLKAIELQTKTIYDVGSIGGCGFHLEIQVIRL